MYQQGYRIHVYQSDYIDFCSGYEALVVSCLTLPSRSIEPLPTLPLSSLMKAELALRTFVSLSVLEHELAHYYMQFRRKALSLGYDLPSWWLNQAKLGTAGAMQILDTVAQDVRKVRAGELFFAHIMLAHHPYVYDRTCRLRNPHDWVGRSEGFGIVNSPEFRIRRYALYLSNRAFRPSCSRCSIAGGRQCIRWYENRYSRRSWFRIYMNAPIVAIRTVLSPLTTSTHPLPCLPLRLRVLTQLTTPARLQFKTCWRLSRTTGLVSSPRATPTLCLVPAQLRHDRHAMIPRPMPDPACVAAQRWGCAPQAHTGKQ